MKLSNFMTLWMLDIDSRDVTGDGRVPRGTEAALIRRGLIRRGCNGAGLYSTPLGSAVAEGIRKGRLLGRVDGLRGASNQAMADQIMRNHGACEISLSFRYPHQKKRRRRR